MRAEEQPRRSRDELHSIFYRTSGKRALVADPAAALGDHRDIGAVVMCGGTGLLAGADERACHRDEDGRDERDS